MCSSGNICRLNHGSGLIAGEAGEFCEEATESEDEDSASIGVGDDTLSGDGQISDNGDLCGSSVAVEREARARS